MPDLNVYPVPNPDVIGRIVDREAVLVLPAVGKVKVLNEVGARIWSLVDGNRTVSQIAELISREYRVELPESQVDTLQFINELAERKILHLSDRPSG